MKKVILVVTILLFLLTLTACSKKEGKDETIPSKERSEAMKVIINKKEYLVDLEKNETVTEFLKNLPNNIEMSELNGNEKYYYLDQKLPNNPINPKQIDKGDIMLFGNNCLVIFYQSFKTNYSYTKIGHIKEMPDLDKDSIRVSFIIN